MIEVDALDRVLEACLSQYYKIGLYLVAFYLRKFLPVELNYDIYDKELLAIINTFK